MPYQRFISTFRDTVLPATLNSYSAIFFFKNRLLALVIMGVTFFNFFAGLSGLIAVLVAVLTANTMGFDKSSVKNGLYSFNALLAGIGMGTFFNPGYVFFSLLLLAALLTLILSVTFGGWLSKYGLPFLSIPFILTFWLIVLPSSQFENLGLTQHNIFWMNKMYAIGGNSMLHLFQTIDSLPVHRMVDIYLRSVSSIFFQDNLISGLFIALALLICSRIGFSLSVIGFIAAYLFAKFSGSEAASITYYNIGANYIMVAIAVGGFFIISSKYSYLWTILLVPLTSLVLLFMSKMLGFIQLPVFSLPFSLVVIFFIFFLMQRSSPSKLKLTPVQYFSPELNLYTFNNHQERLANLLYLPMHPPFWGEWTVTQGHDGELTHKGNWGKAFDFSLVDGDLKSYNSDGLVCQNYYCYNKPVVAPADGFVEEIIDHIDDNEIGRSDTTNNWGNSIIIRHLPGLYTQMSHLRKGSFKVTKGEFVRRGDLLAHCGNSGRSPEPHLHFQVQTTPRLGSATIDYPFAYYYENGEKLQLFSKPAQGAVISGITANHLLKNAFEMSPNAVLSFRYHDKSKKERTERWEAFTDAYNSKYLYCKETESGAYYVNDGMMFYFTSFFGDEESLLYYFYLSAYKVFLGASAADEIKDVLPINTLKNNRIGAWLQDFVAPFVTCIHIWYTLKAEFTSTLSKTEMITLRSQIQVSVFKKIQQTSESTITVKDNCIQEFTYKSKKTNIHAKWLNI